MSGVVFQPKNVETARVIGIVRVIAEKHLGSGNDFALFGGRYHFKRMAILIVLSVFHFDKNQFSSAQCNDVDLALSAAVVALNDAQFGSRQISAGVVLGVLAVGDHRLGLR